MSFNNCLSCKQVIDHEVKMISAYINGKPVYSQWCNACMKKRYESVRDDLGLDKDKASED